MYYYNIVFCKPVFGSKRKIYDKGKIIEAEMCLFLKYRDPNIKKPVKVPDSPGQERVQGFISVN